MDFEKVLPLIVKDFEAKSIRYAVIGGFAIGALGIMRATMDLDFLVNAEDLPEIEKLMMKYGYNCVFKTDNVSQYVSDLKIFGEIDFLHAFRDVSVSMLGRAKDVAVFEDSCLVRVLCPEDIIGLKLQALVNDRTREKKESADIEMLMGFFKNELDWDRIEEFFLLFDWMEYFKELEGLYRHAE